MGSNPKNCKTFKVILYYLSSDEEQSIAFTVPENELFFPTKNSTAVDPENDPLVAIRHREAATIGHVWPAPHGENHIGR